jgi:amino acid adenylation domain-containing protein
MNMSDAQKQSFQLPPEQQAIRDKCFHPTGMFVEFPIEDVETSIPARFEKIVLQHPDRLAVKVGKRALTYDDLNRAANRIARTILALTGQGSEPIALLFEHGIDVIATILGVLKAGKFYVALGFSFPPERNQYMLNDSQARLIVTNGRHFEPASSLASDVCTVLNIELLDDALASENIGCYALPDDLAAIRYTSGSTGEPKGIAESHRKILHQARLTTNDELHICAEDRLTLLHSVSFGSAYPHLYGSLLNGACLLPFDIKSEGIHRLVSWIKDEEITIFKSPPPVFRQLAELLEVEAKFPGLRLIHLSGAPITQPDFDLYKNRFAAGPLLEISMGATEVRGICFALLDQSFSFPQVGSPIGYPRSGRQILLLNESGLEVEPGQTGEIAVKGRNLTLGYWRNPELTEAKLVRDSIAGDEQIYFTGDVGRRMSDGMIIHLGRLDLMVKVRGYRVDISEIERALLTHCQIQEAAVLAWDRDSGDKRLVAYIVCYPKPAPTVTELYEFLRDKLPDYMLPASYLFMDSLPFTNGKPDRMALREPDNSRPALPAPPVLPRNSIEDRLIKIWLEVLGIEEIGIHDNFFELGGHSLLATQIISRIRSAFCIDLPLPHMFKSPTVAEMAAIIAQHQTKRASDADLAQMLREVEAMTEQESQRHLAKENAQSLTETDMSDSHKKGFTRPPEHQAIRDKCSQPTGTFVELPIEDIETSVTVRFEKIARVQSDGMAVKMRNGKIGRNFFIAPTHGSSALDDSSTPLPTPLEESLLRIWAEVLGLDEMGIHDNFFDLGGHSLAAMQVISRVVQTFKLDLPILGLFDTPTVAQMAAIIMQHQAQRPSDAEVAKMLTEVEAMTEEEARTVLKNVKGELS